MPFGKKVEIILILTDSTPAHIMLDEEVRNTGLQLPKGECHVWHVSLEVADDDLSQLIEYLSDDEQKRAAAFLVPAPRARYIVTRSALRLLLGRHLGIPAATVALHANAHGKPQLAPHHEELRFNVSHSGAHALIALCRDSDVGVDIELQRDLDDWTGMARMIWCHADLTRWQSLSAADRSSAFYRAWTRKEAVAKAIGLGMATDFKKLGVSFAPGEDARVLHLDPAFGQVAEWCLIDIATPENYSAALATRTPAIRVMQYRHATAPQPKTCTYSRLPPTSPSP